MSNPQIQIDPKRDEGKVLEGRHKTKMVQWRGDLQMEFVNGSRHESIAGPPWYAIRLKPVAPRDKIWYFWLDYGGPPMVFLTPRMAEEQAKELRKQYKTTYKDVEVILVGPLRRAELARGRRKK